jgi:arylsulfatase B
MVSLSALVAAAVGLPAGAHAARQAKPNFVVIFGDDLGHYDTAIFNDAAPTPTLATLANNGLLLDRHYVFRCVDAILLWYYCCGACSPSGNHQLTRNRCASLLTFSGRYCSPTRRSFLSGRFPNRISTAQPDGDKLCSDFLPLNCSILSEKLATGGYQSHFIGKGHLGYQTMDHLPINRGFTSHVGFLAGSETCA